MKNFALVILVLFACHLYAGSITFHNEEMMMEFGFAWMFNLNQQHPFNEEIHAFTALPVNVYDRMSYNYQSYYFYELGYETWSLPSTSRLQSYQSFPPLTGIAVPDTMYKMTFGERGSDEAFTLCAFTHVNAVNADWQWKTLGQAGDTRLYSGATVYVKHVPYYGDEEILLKINDCSMQTFTSYPQDVGPGASIVGFAWGTLDTEVGDPAWIAQYANPTGQVEFTFSSSSAVVQYGYGSFNTDITLSPANTKRDLVFATEVFPDYTLDALDTHNALLTVTSGDYVCSNTQYYNSSICKHYSSSTGNYPSDIQNHYNEAWWEVGNSLDHSESTIVFDFSGIQGTDNPQNLRVLRRQNGYGVTWLDTNAELLSTDPLRFRVQGYDIMGQYCLASTGGNNFIISLPDDLELVRISGASNDLQLSWSAVSGATYYRVYSASAPNADESQWILEDELLHPTTSWSSQSADPKRFYRVRAVKQ